MLSCRVSSKAVRENDTHNPLWLLSEMEAEGWWPVAKPHMKATGWKAPYGKLNERALCQSQIKGIAWVLVNGSLGQGLLRRELRFPTKSPNQ